MSWVAVAIGGAAVIGGVSAENAEDKQYAASQQALSLNQQQYRSFKKNNKTVRVVGNDAIGRLADILGLNRPAPVAPKRSDYKNARRYKKELSEYQQKLDEFNNRPVGENAWQKDPGYQFRLENTDKTIDRYQSAGRVTGGRAIKEAIRYGQDFASNEFGNSMNRLFTLGGFGVQANNASANAGANYVNNASGIMQGIGNNQAAQYANMNNTIQGAVGNAMTYKTYNDWTNKLNSPTNSG